MRCFISIEFPEHVRAEIFHAFEDLEKEGYCDGAFTKKENLHLTLSFLGEIPDESIEKVKDILEKIDFRKFTIETGDVGFFPSEEHVKVLWVEVVSKELASLKKEIENILKENGIAYDEKDFIPHLTVARIKDIKDKKSFGEYIRKIRLQKMYFIAEDFMFMKSVLKKSGPEYKVIERYGMRIRS